VLDLPDLRITACSVEHIIPCIAVKIVSKASGRSMVYSSDTSPSERLVRFARGAQVLVHEASGRSDGHSSAGDAGWVAQRCGVNKLFLIHYNALRVDLDTLLAEARQKFAGQVELARDMEAFEF
jgi:ribonuclease Z